MEKLPDGFKIDFSNITINSKEKQNQKEKAENKTHRRTTKCLELSLEYEMRRGGIVNSSAVPKYPKCI